MYDISVVYYSKTGSTKKVADVIAKELGVKAINIVESSPTVLKIMFIGSNVYNEKPSEEIMKFIESNNFEGCKVAIFTSSWNSIGNMRIISILSKALTKKGATILGDYHCKGKFLFDYGFPNEEDLDNVKLFVKIIVQELN